MELDVKLNFLANSQAAPDTGATNLKTSASVENKSFESTLNDKRMSAESEKKAENSKKDRAKAEKKPGVKAEKPADAKDDDSKAEDAKKTGKEKKTEAKDKNGKDAKQVEERRKAKAAQATDSAADIQIPELTDEQTEQMLAQIAGALGVSPEQLTEALEKLEIKPNELAIPENMNKLVMEVKGMEEPSELLTAPEIVETLKKLREIVSEAAVKAENAAAINQTSAANPENEARNDSTAKAVSAQTEVTNKAASTAQTTETSAKDQNAEKAGGLTQDVQAEEKPHPAQAAERHMSGHNAQNSGAGAQQNHGFEGGDKPAETQNEITQSTPVVIQKGDETVIEVAGRTVSRSVNRPQTQSADVVNQIIDKMKIDFKPGQTEMKINLRPQELGAVTVKLVSENGVVTAEIVTENSKVKELVEENLQTLRESLKEQGVEVGGLSVSVGQQEQDERMMRFMREKTKSHARMSQIIGKINGEDAEPAEYVNEAELGGYTVDYSA